MSYSKIYPTNERNDSVQRKISDYIGQNYDSHALTKQFRSAIHKGKFYNGFDMKLLIYCF